MNAIDETTSSARTSCGHTFHFGCLATWATRNANCPLCRAALGETDQVQRLTPESSFMPMFEGSERVHTAENWRWQTMMSSLPRLDTLALSAYTPRFRELLQGEGWRHNFAVDMMRRGSSRQWRRALESHLQTLYTERPLERIPFGEELDPIAVEFVMEITHVTQRRAEAYLRFFRDPVETVVCLMHPCDDDPIPDFQERERPPLTEPYVSRYTGNRNSARTGYRDGYESA